MIEHIVKNYDANRNIINLIPRGIDSKEFSKNNLDHDFISTFKSQYGLNDKYIITQVARITSRKDQLTVLSAFEKIKKTIPYESPDAYFTVKAYKLNNNTINLFGFKQPLLSIRNAKKEQFLSPLYLLINS